MTSELDDVVVRSSVMKNMVSTAGREPAIHVRELEFVLEVREGAQTADQRAGAVLDAEVDDQAVELLELEALAVRSASHRG